MFPPFWLDEHGQALPTRRCTRCGREAPIFHFRIEHLKMVGWRLFSEVSHVNWCGHAQEFLVLLDRDGWSWVLPIVGAAR